VRVSLRRLLRPVLLISVSAWALTMYVLIGLVPGSNQRFLEIVFNVESQRAEGDIKARTFYTDYPSLVLYAREVAADGSGGTTCFSPTSAPHSRMRCTSRSGVGSISTGSGGASILELIDFTEHRSTRTATRVNHSDSAVFSVDPAAAFGALTAKNAARCLSPNCVRKS
jgi:hypothetical protein